jgi:hypothetical protein
MYPIGSNLRPWAQRLALSAACGLMLSTAAYAQLPPGFSFPSMPSYPSTSGAASQPAQSPKPLGTVLTVPLPDFGTIVAQNILHQNNVNLLQVSQAAIGDMNTQVATIAITHQNGWGPSSSSSPATTCYLPAGSLNWIKQANFDSTIVEQAAIGFGNQQIAQVQVNQANTGTAAPGTKYLLCPLSGVPAIQALNQKNVNVVHMSQLAIGDNNTQVATLSVNQQNAQNLQVPGSLTSPLVQLNLNLSIISQVAIGNGNTQVATVDVGQANNPSP